MRSFALAAITLIGTNVYAQAQCVKTFVDKCKQYESAAESFQGDAAPEGAGAAAIQLAMQTGFKDQAAAWETAKTKCGEIKKGCQQVCADSSEQCLSELNPITQRAQTEQLKNEDSALKTAGQTQYTDDQSTYERKLAQQQKFDQNGASVQEASGTYVCPEYERCYDKDGNQRVFNPNRTLTITPPNNQPGARTILRPIQDAAGFGI